MEINQLFCDLRDLQCDYADCKGNHGPVISKFSQMLNRYHQNYYDWEPLTEEEKAPPKPKHSLVSEAVFVGVIIGLFFLFNFVVDSPFWLCMFYVASGISFSAMGGNQVWGILVSVLVIPLSLFKLTEACVVVFIVALLTYVIYALIQQLSAVKGTKSHRSEIKQYEDDLRKIEKDLEADRKEMNRLLPQLFAEFREKQQEILRNSNETIDEEVLKMCSELPPLFWWQISPQQLKSFEEEYSKGETDDKVVWETRWVKRSPGKEFPDAGSEYSPLVEYKDTSEEYKQIYDEVKKEFFADPSAGVFDFISRGSATEMEEEYFQYEDYAHSDFKRFSDKMLWYGLGNNIDNAKRNGEITDEQYAYLSSAYVTASAGVYSGIDEKVEKTGMKYQPVKVSTNIWVGQMLLADDDKGDGIAIVDYRSQIPHLFKNIDALEDIRITRVCGDPVRRNPMVLAKIHKVCELCR